MPIRTYHGGPEINLSDRSKSKLNRGLKLSAPNGPSRARIIVSNGQITEPKRFKKIVASSPMLRSTGLSPMRQPESLVTGKTLLGREAYRRKTTPPRDLV